MPNELYIYDGFITAGSGTITGSFNVSGSTTQIGNNTLLGNTTLTGSVTISGSVPPGSTSPSIQVYGDIRQSGYHRFDPVTTNIDTSISASYIYVSSSTNDLYFSQNSAGYANATRLRWVEGNLYSGLLHGGIITQSGSTAYRVSSGSGIIVTLNTSYNEDPYPTVQFLEWPTLIGTITALSSSYDQQFIAISSSAGTPVIVAQGTPYSDGDYNTIIPIGIVIHQNRSSINAVQTFPSTAYGWKQRSYDFVKAFGPLKISGYTLSASGSSTGSLLLSGGTAFVEGRNYIVDPNNPSYIVEANGITTSKIYKYYQSGSNWQSTWGYDTNGGTGYTVIDPTKYSNAGTLTSVGSNKWSIQRVYYFPNSATKAFYIYYGNAQYDNKLDALAALTTETFTEAPNTLANAIFVGYMVLRDDANFTVTPSYEFRAAGMFRGSSAGGGSTGGATALANLTDVSVTSPANGELLQYNSVTSKWTNTRTLTGSYTLSGSLNVNGSLTGSLFGTATSSSYATSAVTSSYITTNQPSSGSTYSILLTDSSNPGLVYRSASLQYDPAANVILTTIASSSNSVFGAYNESVPLETGYAIVVTPYGEAGQLEAPNTLKFDPFANSLTVTASYAYTASFATTASFVRNAVTASYVLNAVSASFASTASFVNTLNQNVLITGSLTIGTSSIGANENTLILGPSPAGGTGEGGQILLQAPGGTYTSASMFDNYQNSTRLLRGTNAGSDAIVAQWNMHTKQMSLPAYNSTSAFSGTVVGLLAFDSSGNVITTTTGSGGGGGGSGTVNSGTAGYLAYYPGTGTTVDDTSGLFWDAATSRLGIGTATPNSGALHVSGGVFATSFTGSLLGTATTASFASTASFVNTLNQNVVITGSLGIAQTTPTSRLHINANQNSVTQADANGILLANSTAATVGVQSISPALVLQGNGWKTDATAGSQDVRFRIETLPVQGSTNPSATFRIASSINNAAYTTNATLTSDGNLSAVGGLSAASQIQVLGVSSYAVASYRLTNGGSNFTTQFIAGSNSVSPGFLSIGIDYTSGGGAGLLFFGATNNARIARASINIVPTNNTPVSESADLILQTQSGGTAMTTKMLISGSGNVTILSGSLGIQQTTPTSRLHLNFNQNSASQNDANGILLANSTAATANTQSISPGIVLQGNGWKTTATAGSQDVRFRMDVLPVQGTTNPTATLQIASSINGGSYDNFLTYTSAGVLTSAARIETSRVVGTSQIVVVGQNNITTAYSYQLTNSGGSSFTRIAFGATAAAGAKQLNYDVSNNDIGLAFSAFNASSNLITRAAINIVNLNNTAGAETGNLILQTQSGGTAMTTKMLISGSGNVSILSGSLGVGTLNPNSASLHVNGNIFATAITASFINGGTDLIDLSSPSGITISTTGSGFVNINTGLTGTVRISSPLIVTGSILSLDNITAYSDESVKSNVVNIPNALNKVLEMRGVTYTRTDLQDTERIHAGVIAQELERQFPEVVYELPNGKKTVAYGNITSILIEAIKEQQKQIDDLRKQIEKLT